MEKQEIISGSHAMSINERKSIYITGVLKIDSFDDEEFLLETSMGYLVIKGVGLELMRLDTKDGIVSIKGQVISTCYMENIGKGKKKSSVIESLFK